jgi:hypothetical protein
VPADLTSAVTSAPLRVFVGHDSVLESGADTVVAVAAYLVRFRITHPSVHGMPTPGNPGGDTSRVVLANEAGRISAADTTDEQGIASRQIRISTAVQAIPDSVVVEALVTKPDNTPVRGSPVVFTVRVVQPTIP